jgi:hypothetical protein
MIMRYELHHPEFAGGPDRPLVGGVEALDAGRPAPRGEERDEAIIQLLREKLKARDPGNRSATPPARDGEAGPGEDRYEPQRLGRKICWQYDASARKVPLLRRHYI